MWQVGLDLQRGPGAGPRSHRGGRQLSFCLSSIIHHLLDQDQETCRISMNSFVGTPPKPPLLHGSISSQPLNSKYIMSFSHGSKDRHSKHRQISPSILIASALERGWCWWGGEAAGEREENHDSKLPKFRRLELSSMCSSAAYGKSITSLNLRTKTWQVWCRHNQEQRSGLDYSGPLEF